MRRIAWAAVSTAPRLATRRLNVDLYHFCRQHEARSFCEQASSASIVTVRITSVDALGRGVGVTKDGECLAVALTLPGEIVTAMVRPSTRAPQNEHGGDPGHNRTKLAPPLNGIDKGLSKEGIAQTLGGHGASSSERDECSRDVTIEGAPLDNTRSILSQREADLIHVLTPSPSRIDPKCPLFGTCDGCQLQHATIEKQREIKRLNVAKVLEAAVPGAALVSAAFYVFCETGSMWLFQQTCKRNSQPLCTLLAQF